MYTHSAVQHFKSPETGKWKASHIGIRRFRDGWKSGETFFNAAGKSDGDAYIDIMTIEQFPLGTGR
jgi:hypothetical protein